MPIGFVRRLARLSLTSEAVPVLAENWTTEETTTYVPATPAVGAVAWGGTIANLDRDFTKTGSTRTALGALLTFVHKPEANALGQHGSLAGAIVKVAVTYAAGSTAALELWSLKGVTWTKRRRVAIAQLARSGDVVVFDLTGPVLDTSDVDAYWVTLAPDLGTETLTWTILHLFGICPNDPVTPDCPPGTPPENCAAPECGVDVEDWVCQPPPDEPAAPTTDPFVLPPIPVKIPFPPSRLGCSGGQPPFNVLRMTFGEIPTGGSILVTAVSAQGVTFVQGYTQTISAPGDLDWKVLSGFHFTPGPAEVFPVSSAFAAALGPNYPKVDPTGMVFTFQLQLAGSAFAVAGVLLDILTYFWTFGYRNDYVC